MSNYHRVQPGDTIQLFYYATDGATGLTVTYSIKDTDNNEITSGTLTHDANGRYTATYTPDGTYSWLRVDYDPSDNYEKSSDTITVGYEYRPQMGETGVSYEDLIETLKPILQSIDEIKLELSKKSEFDPNTDKVRTDLKIPTIKEITSSINKVIVANKPEDLIPKLNNLAKVIKVAIDNKKIPEPKDYSGDFIQVQKAISKIPKTDLTNVFKAIESLKPLISALDKFQSLEENIEKIKKLNNQIIEKIPKDRTEEILDSLNKTIKEIQNSIPDDNTETIRKFLVAVRNQLLRKIIAIK